jgi:hypothetical protein
MTNGRPQTLSTFAGAKLVLIRFCLKISVGRDLEGDPLHVRLVDGAKP